jgi:hypothetical protein
LDENQQKSVASGLILLSGEELDKSIDIENLANICNVTKNTIRNMCKKFSKFRHKFLLDIHVSNLDSSNQLIRHLCLKISKTVFQITSSQNFNILTQFSYSFIMIKLEQEFIMTQKVEKNLMEFVKTHELWRYFDSLYEEYIKTIKIN